MKINKYIEAFNDFDAAIQLDETNSNAYKKLSKCYLRTGKVTKAKETLIKLLASLNDEGERQYVICEKNKLEDIERLEKQAKDAFRNTEYAKVVELMDKCLENSEICIRHKILKAKCLVYLQKFEEASRIVDEILFTYEDNSEAIFIRGLCLIYQGKYKLGLEDCKSVINECHKAKEVHDKYKNIEKLLNHAYNKYKQNNLEEAKDIYTKILHMDPKNLFQKQNMHWNLAKVFYKEKNFEEVLLHCTNILMLDENNINVLILRAEASEQLKDYEEAVEDYTKILNLEECIEIKQNLCRAKSLLVTNKIDSHTRLGLRRGCSIEEIRKAWKRLSLQYHPDKKVSDPAEQALAARKYHKIKKAYEELSATFT